MSAEKMDKFILKFGVAGAGRIGEVHIKNLLDLKAFEIVAVYVRVESEQEWAKGLIPEVRAYESYKEPVLDHEIEAVAIFTPTDLHKEQIRDALAAGKHVFREKPLAANNKDARFALVFVKAAQKIREGYVGRISTSRAQTMDKAMHSETFFNLIKTSGVIFTDNNIHDVDMCLYLLGEHVTAEEAYATGTTNVYLEFQAWDNADDVYGIVKFKEGKKIAIYGNRNNVSGHETIADIIGDKGRIAVNPSPKLRNIEIWTRVVCRRIHRKLKAFREWVLVDKKVNFNLRDAAKAVTIADALQNSLR
ncbi:hypothetical protein V1511DRAFT_523328 [Dipodascopsis uninucleata]